MMDRETAIEKAKAAQRAMIFTWMLQRFVGGGRQIARWHDHCFSLCTFCTWHSAGSDDVAKRRRAFNRLAADGVIERQQYKPGTPIQYRFPREFCDAVAAEAIAHYEAMGYSQDEIRPRSKEVSA